MLRHTVPSYCTYYPVDSPPRVGSHYPAGGAGCGPARFHEVIDVSVRVHGNALRLHNAFSRSLVLLRLFSLRYSALSRLYRTDRKVKLSVKNLLRYMYCPSTAVSKPPTNFKRNRIHPASLGLASALLLKSAGFFGISRKRHFNDLNGRPFFNIQPCDNTTRAASKSVVPASFYAKFVCESGVWRR
jgi:hypothetical protein